MKKLSIFGRTLFAVPIAVFGIIHLAKTNDMVSIVPGFLSWGGHIFVILTGLALILTAVSVIVEKPSRLLALFLGIMILMFALTVHLVNLIHGDPNSLSQLLKDLSLAGAAFYISANTSTKKEPVLSSKKT